MSMVASTLQPPDVGPGSRRYGWIFGAVWLVYLLNPLSSALDNSGWKRVVGVGSVAVFVVAYLVGITFIRRARWQQNRVPTMSARDRVGTAAVVAVLAAAVFGMITGAGQSGLNGVPFIAAMIVMTVPLRVAVGSALGLFGIVEFASHRVDGWADGGYGFGVVLAAVATFAIRLAFERSRQLLKAQEELSDLAVEEERSRIARDLHDILGHSLTVIAVKAELAERMLDVDPARARSEIIDLQKLSRDALADVRATALGVRGVSLLNEIAEARVALESAGIDADLPTVADDVPSKWRDTFAWTIRECVTNVIRHSHAQRCVVEMSPTRLTVRDDGVGFARDAATEPPTQGLDGLRRRVEAAGAALRLGSGPGGVGAEVTVEVPA